MRKFDFHWMDNEDWFHQIENGSFVVNDDAPLFKNPETQKLMFEGTAFYGDSDIPENCHGFWPEEREVRVYGHGGSTLFGNADMNKDGKVNAADIVILTEIIRNTL